MLFWASTTLLGDLRPCTRPIMVFLRLRLTMPRCNPGDVGECRLSFVPEVRADSGRDGDGSGSLLESPEKVRSINVAGVRDCKGEVTPLSWGAESMPSPIMGAASAAPDCEVDFRPTAFSRLCALSESSSQSWA